MKQLLVIAVVSTLFVLVWSDAAEDKLKQVLGGCVKSSGVDPKVVEDAFQRKILSEEQSFKDYLGCFFDAGGFARPDGYVDFDAVRKKAHLFTFIAVNDRKTVIDGCDKKQLKGPTIAETAFLNFKCYIGQ